MPCGCSSSTCGSLPGFFPVDPIVCLFSLGLLLTETGCPDSPNYHFELIDSAGHDWLELRVTDDGAGIDPVDNRIIFDKFTQSSNTPNCGTGLGLSICREIVELHRGGIRAENSPGRGATLIVRLPRRRTDKSISGETDVRGNTEGAFPRISETPLA